MVKTMSYTPSTPITGASQTGLTSPTHTISVDVAPDINGKQYAVTALGGTQTGATVNSLSSPFTLTFVRPKGFKLLGQPNPTTGQIKNVPRNVWKLLTRKGVTPAANQSPQVLLIETIIHVPAGADGYDKVNIATALSAHIGMLNQQSSGIGDTVCSGVM